MGIWQEGEGRVSICLCAPRHHMIIRANKQAITHPLWAKLEVIKIL